MRSPDLLVIGAGPYGLAVSAHARHSGIDTVTLDYDERHRRRRRYVGAGGLEFLLDLPEARVLKQGDGLALEGGGFVEVHAAVERLIEVRAASPGLLARLAWHLGNRHLPADVDGERILIRDDHVIVDMLRGLGAAVRTVEAPFNPEGGAYVAAAPAHGHDHDRHHDHDHHGHDDHDHGHAHHRHGDHLSVGGEPHVHAPGCDHDHDQDHEYEQELRSDGG